RLRLVDREAHPPRDGRRDVLVGPFEAEARAHEEERARALRDDEGHEGAVERAAGRRAPARELTPLTVEGDDDERGAHAVFAVEPDRERLPLGEPRDVDERVDRAAGRDAAVARAREPR